MSEPRAPRTLTLLPERFAICRFAPDAPLPAWVFHDSATVWSLTRTPRELSLVCPEGDLPPSVDKAERGWRGFEIEGPIPFGVTGVVSALTTPLAAAGIPVFVISTYDTDLLLVQETFLDRAGSALATDWIIRSS